ncbi:MAG: hypothetical protein ACI4V2_05250 [Alloprevotella sp.]
MRARTLKNRLTASMWTLPVMAVATPLVWACRGSLTADGRGLALGALAATAWLLAEINSRFALLRVRSRMVSASFLAFAATMPWLFDESGSLAVVTVAVAAAWWPLFGAYDVKAAAAPAFRAALCLSLGSLFFPPLLLLLPVAGFCLMAPLRAAGWRVWAALLMGGVLPYVYWGLYVVLDTGRLTPALTTFEQTFDFSPLDYSVLSPVYVATLAALALMALAATLHYVRTAFNDKIRVRMFFYVLITFEVATAALMVIMPRAYRVWTMLLALEAAPLVAHHLTLSRGRWGTVWFWLAAALLAVPAVVKLLAL